MNIENELTKISMFLDGELSNSEMNKVEKIIDTSDDAKNFIINAAKANAYSKSFFRNEIDKNEIVLPDNNRKFRFKFMLQAASIVFLLGIGILMGNIIYDRPVSNFAFTDNIINPAYQNVLNTVLENYKSGVPYKGRIPELDMQITIIPEKTYKVSDGYYIRKFVIAQGISDKNIGIKGFAERKSKESWEIKTLEF